MISPELLHQILAELNVTFYTGVPDSLLKDFLAYLSDHIPTRRHVVAANEGGAVAVAAGHYVASLELPVVYMQNSGLGNAANPLLSLADPGVYGIPMLLLVGWRGEPGVKDEPQHVLQGEITPDMLRLMGIPYVVLDDEEALAESIASAVEGARARNGPYALLARRGAFERYTRQTTPESELTLSREAAIDAVRSTVGRRDVIVSTTGHISRELFECRERRSESHESDFLMVGSMGHASQFALGVALNDRDRRVFCLDGDGAALMHMGSLAVIGQCQPANFHHVLLNNGVHDSVGAQATAGFDVDFVAIARACGYRYAARALASDELLDELSKTNDHEGPIFLEVRVLPGARAELRRPTMHPRAMRDLLVSFLARESN